MSLTRQDLHALLSISENFFPIDDCNKRAAWLEFSAAYAGRLSHRHEWPRDASTEAPASQFPLNWLYVNDDVRLWASLAGEDEAGSFLCGAKGVFTVHLHYAFEESRFALTADAGAAFIRDFD